MNIGNKSQRTELHYTCEQHYRLFVKMILESSADTNVQDRGCRAPLLLATMAKREETMNILLSTRKASWNIPDDKGSTPLIIAAQNGYTRIVGILTG